jgi:transcriptional regulator with XRE-family HTH domain
MRQVVEHMGYSSKHLVTQWEYGTSQVNAYDITRLARLYGVDEAWLFAGREGKEAGSKKVVKASLAMLRDYARIADLPESEGAIWSGSFRIRPHSPNLSNRALAFETIDRGLAPEIDVGDVVICDGKPDPGEIALFVLRETGEVLLRRYQGKKNLAPPFVLTSTNTRIGPRKVTKADDPICLGAFVEAIKFGRARQSRSTKASA